MTVFGRLAALTALVLAATLTPALATGGGTAGTAAGGGSNCGGHPPRVPGAEFMISACLPDLTTGGTVASGHTDPADW